MEEVKETNDVTPVRNYKDSVFCVRWQRRTGLSGWNKLAAKSESMEEFICRM